MTTEERAMTFRPEWTEQPPPPGSWRALFKWGAADRFKHPNDNLYSLMKEAFGLTDEHFREPRRLGLEPVRCAPPCLLAPEDLAAFAAMLGPDNVRTDGPTRLAAASGKTMLDLLRLREGLAEHLPDAVLRPRHRQDVARIVAHCAARGIPVTPRGGGTSVTRGLECPRGGVSLDLSAHLNRVIRFNEVDQTITVEAGLYGPELEAVLNRAPELFGAARAYTCGHFPQSFEFSTVGGWAATRGAGQESTYYGKVEDLVLAQEMVTPAGILRTGGFPAAATGPDTDQILLGSEGAFGVVTEVTLRIFRHRPENRQRYSFLFPDWPRALAAARAILQEQGGMPSVFRLSDPEETEVILRLYGVQRPALDRLFRLAGLEPGRRCLLLGCADGELGFARNVRRCVARISRAHGARSCTGLVTRAWEHSRFLDPYLREDLQDHGIVTDTLECAVTWADLERVHREVRAVCHRRPRTVCMTHLSHGYPQGANLYFIFLTVMSAIPDYLDYQAAILDAILAQGAALSHHHGIGRMTAPWLEAQLGAGQLALFRAIKGHLDPGGIMNPGGTLALDLPEAQRRLNESNGKDDPNCHVCR
jgi:alkyldihydroxyacetonephosphate synthase